MRIRFTVAMIALLAASEVRLRGQRVCQIGTICPKEGDPRNLPPPDGGLPFPDDPKTAKFTAGDCRDLPNHHVSADGKSCVPNGGCPIIPIPFFSNPKCTPTPITGGGAVDPNDKVGPVGPGAAQFITTSLPLRYTILFENLATAPFPAQRVLVTDPLDPAAINLSTFSLGTISFGDARLNPPPGLKSYSAAVDLRPAQNIIVHINAALDAATGVLRWQFDSIDPDTMEVT